MYILERKSFQIRTERKGLDMRLWFKALILASLMQVPWISVVAAESATKGLIRSRDFDCPNAVRAIAKQLAMRQAKLIDHRSCQRLFGREDCPALLFKK